jgi:membrane peptidoglycan carboxypeptidase
VLKKGGTWIGGLAAFVVVSLACGVLGAGLILPAVAVTSATADTAKGVLDAIPDELGIPALSQKSYLYSSDGTLLTTFYAQNRIVVPLDAVSQPMQDAVVSLEDRRFWEHSGVDVQGMARAMVNNAVDGSTQGASTLTQQYVKNVLIERGVLAGDKEAQLAAQDVSYLRKLKEAKLAVSLEAKAGKKKILEGYLNIAQFGPSLYGVEAAANYYFGVSAKDLNIVQSATIAAVTQKPNGLDPQNYPEANKERRDAALDGMLRDKKITKEEHDEAVATDVTASLSIHPTATDCEVADKQAGAGFFCDYVKYTIRNSPEFGETAADREALLNRGGLHVTTTLDLRIQQDALDAIEKRMANDRTDLGHALTSVEPGTGRIIAMAQNREYKLGTPKGNATSVNYNTDYDYGGSTGFQAGSTFKPFILAEWLNAGHSLREPFNGSQTSYTKTKWKASGCMPEGVYRLDKWNIRGSTGGMVDAYTATARSINTAYAAMEYQLDLCKIQTMLEGMGIHRADGKDWALSPSMVLGTNEVSPLTMAEGYATFASGGMYCPPVAIDKIVGPDGKEIPVPSSGCTRAMSEGVASGVTAALQRVVSGGTGTNGQISDGRPTAGKTGTTDGSVAVWFCGYTPQLATAVWAGYPARSKKLGGQWAGATGGRVPALTFKWFMSAALKGTEKMSFGKAPSEIDAGEKIRIPQVVGLTEEAATQQLQDAGFTVSVAPNREYSSVGEGLVVSQSPNGGGSAYLGTQITLVLSAGARPGGAPAPDPGSTETH